MLKIQPLQPTTLQWWYEQHLDLRIDMSPSYQRRGEIWSKWKRAHLIDSILNDFDIPKFYISNFLRAHSPLNENKKGYAIIDGKQRLGAIFDFFEDKFPLNPSFKFDDEPSLELGGLFYSDLRLRYPAVSRRVDNFSPTIMDVVTDDTEKITELFIRLNMGEAANSAERRNAMQGPVPALVRELAVHPFFMRKIKFSTARMQEFNLIVKIFMFEHLGEFSDTKAKNLDKFAEEADNWSREHATEENPMGPYRETSNKIYEVLERLNKEFMDKDPLLTKQGEIPIYYWAARNFPDKTNELRDFVLEFSESVMDNMRGQRDEQRQGNQELTTYYTLSRTTNDLHSYVGRYRIFEKRFLEYLRAPGRVVGRR